MFKISVDFDHEAMVEDEQREEVIDYFALPEVSEPKPEDYKTFNI